MYCNHYEFSKKPFDVTPDPRFLYLTSNHREILASLIYGIQERRGFITIVGEVGMGKTTLLNATLDRMNDKTKVAYIFNTDVTFDELLHMALYEWGIITSRQSLPRINAIQQLNEFAIRQLAKGGNVVLIVDEAQNLDSSVLENMRLLSNLETQRHKLVQIVISGQPELDTKLAQHELRQLAQRISLKRYILPLNKKDTYAYLHHRLSIANSQNTSLFDPEAQQLIWDYSGGIPRKINILCDNALLIGYGLNKKNIKAAIIREAVKDLKWCSFSNNKKQLNFSSVEAVGQLVEKRPTRRPLALAITIVFVSIVTFLCIFFISIKEFQFLGPTSFNNNQKETALERFYPIPKNQKAQLMFFEPHTHLTEHRNVTEKLPAESVEPKASVENKIGIGPIKHFHNDELNHMVVVKPGDTLSGIISQRYNVYDDTNLNKVLRKNPSIINPHRIFVGQVIKLPAGKDKINYQ